MNFVASKTIGGMSEVDLGRLCNFEGENTAHTIMKYRRKSQNAATALNGAGLKFFSIRTF